MFKKYNIYIVSLVFSFLAIITIAQADNGSFRETREAREPRDVQEIICDRLQSRVFGSPLCEDEPLPPPEPEAFCGDGVVNQEAEECDGQDGLVEGFHCTDQCLLETDEPLPPPEPEAFCGDGVVNQEAEECDGQDGLVEGFHCTDQCLLETDVIVSGRVVINEVYADVDAGKGNDGANEWIELYNAGDASVNLLDWQIEDASQSVDVIQDDIELEPGEFALISPDSSTYDNFWSAEIPEGTHLIVLEDARIGNGLRNGGDSLFLKNSQGIVDAMSYGDDESVFALPAAGDGQSLTRSPNGQDTNTINDWLEIDEPTPGL